MKWFMKLYEIRNTENKSIYVGITRTTLDARWRAHKCAAKRGTRSIIYDAMRSFGIDKFTIHPVSDFESEEELLQAERDLIKFHRDSSEKCYNILDGGASYFPIQDRQAWKVKLSAARQGKKPALGMKHTDENRKKFSEFGKLRWDMYGRYPEEVVGLKYKDAHTKYGISKTHYYRLRKQALTNAEG